MHRVRDRLMQRRTALINEIRGGDRLMAVEKRCAWKAQNAFHFSTATTTKIAESSTEVC
jgi:hypothetical protein